MFEVCPLLTEELDNYAAIGAQPRACSIPAVLSRSKYLARHGGRIRKRRGISSFVPQRIELYPATVSSFQIKVAVRGHALRRRVGAQQVGRTTATAFLLNSTYQF